MEDFKGRNPSTTTMINFLPQDLIVDIVARVVSTSPTAISDLDNLRVSCKMFYEASKARKVGQCIPVKKGWNMHSWMSERYFAVLENCADAGNLDAWFVLGTERIYSLENIESGMDYLNKAAAGGSKSATYAMGILLFGSPTTRSLGIELLTRLGDVSGGAKDPNSTAASSPRIERCRAEVGSLAGSVIWRWRAARTKPCSNPKCGELEENWANQSFCSPQCVVRHGCNLGMRVSTGELVMSSCANPICGRVEKDWASLGFCSQVCRWRYEYLALYKKI